MGPQVRTTVTPATNINVNESSANTVELKQGTTVAHLIAALTKVHTPTRDIIAVLESLQRSGALHAELIIQ
jgi:flagellar P-ring protein precursor FlgI